MKVVYNNKEIINNTNNYNSLLNRPMMNSKTLEGAITLSNVNAYSKQQIDELIGQSRSIEIVSALPVNLIENTLYYVGPDANDFYTVYLVDEVRNVFEIGTSQFGEYFAGTGINIDSDNYITTKIDNKTIVVDEDNNLHANIDIDSVPVMVGATSSADGEKGLVPAPNIGDNINSLTGAGTGKNIMNLMYPINSVYIAYDNTTDPNVIMPGTTGTKLDSNYALGTANSSSASQYLTSQMPKFTSSTQAYLYRLGDSKGPLYFSISRYSELVLTTGLPGYGFINFDSSRSWPGYKADQTIVQPKAIKVCMGRRTA